MTNNGASLLAVNNIEVIYDRVILVLKGVSLEVPEGGIVALLGANGAGKTTTLKAISNLLKAERGEVTKGSIEYRSERVDRLTPSDLVKQVGNRFKRGGRAQLKAKGRRDEQRRVAAGSKQHRSDL